VDEPNSPYLRSCDTMVAFTGPPEARRAVFAKNSDRPGLESQPLTQVPAATYEPGSTMRSQYLTIPQVPRTLAVLGSRPYWLWGFEHGVNEAGVAIGNEAIYTHDPVPDTGLLGMDLVRLGLERGATAAEAKKVITGLLERHGQGGGAVVGGDRRYHNSFIVADATEAWVIETSRRHWVARRTTRGAVISNLITIEDDWEECSDGLEEHAREMGYWSEPASTRFNFRAAYEDPESRHWTEPRYGVGCRLLAEHGEHDVPQLMRYLRDHFEAGTVNGTSADGMPVDRTVCIHPSPARGSTGSTAASMVVELTPDELPPVAWVAMATPCTGIFLPVTVGQRLPSVLTTGDERPSRDSAWWAMRELQYVTDRDAVLLTPIAQAVWGPLEQKLLAEDPRLSDEALARLTADIMERRDRLILELTVAQLESDHAVILE
jgi:secernin